MTRRAAALREAEEEIGLSPVNVDIVGLGAPYFTASGFHIQPVVGVIRPDLSFVLSPDEVEAVFEVPLAYLLDERNAQLRSDVHEGRHRRYFEYDWQDRHIWGVTAGILHNLSYQLRDMQRIFSI